MLQDIRVLLIEAEEAIKRLVSVKARIAAELARQVAEAPGKTIGAKKRKVLSGLGQEERKTVTELDQHFREKIFGDPEKPKPKKKAPEPAKEHKEPKDEALVLTTKRARVMVREPTPEPIEGKILKKLVKNINKSNLPRNP